MKFTRLFLPGNFEDAYVYMGQLVALTVERDLEIYNLERILSSLEARYEDISPVLRLMFLRNDWLAGALFQLLMQSKDISRDIISMLERFPQPFILLDTRFAEPQKRELKVPAHVILDMTIYNSRLYMGADNGFYHTDIRWEQESTAILEGIKKRLDARCLSTSARFGAVTASCGDNGLFAAYDDFGWVNKVGTSKVVQVADRSLRTAWVDHSLMNYPTYTEPFLHPTSYERVQTKNTADLAKYENEATVLTQVNEKQISLSNLFQVIQEREKRSIPPDSIQYVYNSNKDFFVHTRDGSFFSVRMQYSPKDSEPKFRYSRTDKGDNVRILSVNTTKVGLVIETDYTIFLFSNGEWFHILDAEVLTVRTFPRSKRFQNMVAITTEEGIWLIGLFDDSKSGYKEDIDGISY
jgi:hypothetical protein